MADYSNPPYIIEYLTCSLCFQIIHPFQGCFFRVNKIIQFISNLLIYIGTYEWGLKVRGPYQAEPLGQISLTQSPRQETFWASAGFENTENPVMLSDAPS